MIHRGNGLWPWLLPTAEPHATFNITRKILSQGLLFSHAQRKSCILFLKLFQTAVVFHFVCKHLTIFLVRGRSLTEYSKYILYSSRTKKTNLDSHALGHKMLRRASGHFTQHCLTWIPQSWPLHNDATHTVISQVFIWEKHTKFYPKYGFFLLNRVDNMHN